MIAGEGKVTPRKGARVELDGETLVPGRDRMAVDHELVARHPEWFERCWDGDVLVRTQMVAYLERATHRGRTPKGPGRIGPEDNYGLGPARIDRPSWDLRVPRTTEASWRL